MIKFILLFFKYSTTVINKYKYFSIIKCISYHFVCMISILFLILFGLILIKLSHLWTKKRVFKSFTYMLLNKLSLYIFRISYFSLYRISDYSEFFKSIFRTVYLCLYSWSCLKETMYIDTYQLFLFKTYVLSLKKSTEKATTLLRNMNKIKQLIIFYTIPKYHLWYEHTTSISVKPICQLNDFDER